MRKFFACLMILAISLTCMVVSFAEETTTEPEMKTVYISDNGNDVADGSTALSAVKTFGRAAELLGKEGGIMLIPDKFTYFNETNDTCPYYLPGVEGASYIIRGEKADGSSVFAGERYMIVTKYPLTFDNLTYTIGPKTRSLAANYKEVVFTETVKGMGYTNPDTGETKYLNINGGSAGIQGKDTDLCKLVLNGGCFGNVYGGPEKQKTAGDIQLTLGGNVEIHGDVFLGGWTSSEVGVDVTGNIYFNMNGGKIDGKIYVGGQAKEGSNPDSNNNYVSSYTVDMTIRAGEFGGIVGTGANGATIDVVDLWIDLTQFEASKEANWKETKLFQMPDYAKVWTFGETKVTEPETDEPTGEVTNVPTSEPTKEPAAPTQSPETQAPVPGTQAGTTEAPKKGCGAVVGIGSILAILSLAGVMLCKKGNA
ncbi:MAG: hypothetical protein E7620_04320 [Ruminococcaceae bacterium]|nr:hypothetical protein [Oscillospiraceae bacterium]